MISFGTGEFNTSRPQCRCFFASYVFSWVYGGTREKGTTPPGIAAFLSPGQRVSGGYLRAREYGMSNVSPLVSVPVR